MNKKRPCSLKDYNEIIREAQNAFSKGDYDCIIMIYSGHETNDKINLSDYDGEQKVENETYIS